MANKVKIIAEGELNKMHTGSLLKRRSELLSCDESFQLSDRYGVEKEPDSDITAFIEFKESKIWKQAYKELINILSSRENVKSKEEKRLERKEKAKHAKTNKSRKIT